VKYDDRRKEMIHTTTEIREAKIGEDIIGEVSLESKGTYNEEGIRKILKDLVSKKKVLEGNIKTLKELQTKVTLTKEQEKLKEDLKILQLANHQENTDKAKLEKEFKDLKDNKKEWKKVNKDIQDIENAIGSRLKF